MNNKRVPLIEEKHENMLDSIVFTVYTIGVITIFLLLFGCVKIADSLV